MRNLNAALDWSQEAELAFIMLKQFSATAAELAIPDYSLPFYLDLSGTENVVNGILFQRKEGVRVILRYISVMLDNMEKRHPRCTQHAAGYELRLALMCSEQELEPQLDLTHLAKLQAKASPQEKTRGES